MAQAILINIIFLFTLFALPVQGEKKLSEKELSEKKEGWYPTGLPILIYNSDLGFGYGAVVVLYNNGGKNDKYFDSTPYFLQIGALLQKTTKGMFNYEGILDSPYLFNTKFRLRSNMGFIRILYDNYFGIGEQGYRDLAGTNSKMADAITFLEQKGNDIGLTHGHYYNFTKELFYERLTLEREFAGNFKFLIGNGIGKFSIETFDQKLFSIGENQFAHGTTLLSEQRPPGFAGGWSNYLSLGLAYDNRDFEPDPNKGVFADITYEIYDQSIGSQYNFQRFSCGVRLYYSLFQDMVFAARGAFGASTGNVPFFEMTYVGLSDKRVEAIGGITSVKGFTQRRFIGKAISFFNLEMRYRFIDFKIKDELFKLIFVPFWDIGRAFDDISEVHFDKNWRPAYGGALRISWNLNFIINISYGYSKEDTYVAIDIFHPF